jgi:hypothetical protein
MLESKPLKTVTQTSFSAMHCMQRFERDFSAGRAYDVNAYVTHERFFGAHAQAR